MVSVFLNRTDIRAHFMQAVLYANVAISAFWVPSATGSSHASDCGVTVEVELSGYKTSVMWYERMKTG